MAIARAATISGNGLPQSLLAGGGTFGAAFLWVGAVVKPPGEGGTHYVGRVASRWARAPLAHGSTASTGLGPR